MAEPRRDICPVCNSLDTELWGFATRYEHRPHGRCRTCGTTYQRPNGAVIRIGWEDYYRRRLAAHTPPPETPPPPTDHP